MTKLLNRYPVVPRTPFPWRPPSIGTLTLCFFFASLFTKDPINSSKTIRCYVSHAKNYWIKLGCDPEFLESKELFRVLRGVSWKLPPKADTTPPYLLLHYNMPLEYRHPITSADCRKLTKVVFGFFGMVRFHVLKKLNINSFVLVTIRGLGKKKQKHSTQKKAWSNFLQRSVMILFWCQRQISSSFHGVLTEIIWYCTHVAINLPASSPEAALGTWFTNAHNVSQA